MLKSLESRTLFLLVRHIWLFFWGLLLNHVKFQLAFICLKKKIHWIFNCSWYYLRYLKSLWALILWEVPDIASLKRNTACFKVVRSCDNIYSAPRTKLMFPCTHSSPLGFLSSFRWFPGNCNNKESSTACLLLYSICSPLASSQRGCFWWISNISGVQRICLNICDIVTN